MGQLAGRKHGVQRRTRPHTLAMLPFDQSSLARSCQACASRRPKQLRTSIPEMASGVWVRMQQGCLRSSAKPSVLSGAGPVVLNDAKQ